MTGWLDIAQDDPFGVHNLPYGVFTTADRPRERRIGVAVGSRHVVDAGAAARAAGSAYAGPLGSGTLNPLLAAGRPVWRAVRAELAKWLSDERHRAAVEPHLLPRDAVRLRPPFGERLVGARCAGMGVRAPGAVPGKVVRHLGLAVGRPAGRPSTRPYGPAGA